MSCEHCFCTWGCQKEARANSQDHSRRKVYQMMSLRQVRRRLVISWLQAKRLKNYQKFLKLAPGTQQICEGVKV